MILNFFKGEPVPIYGEGNQIRDWTFVEDNCIGIYLAATKGDNGDIYNISANDEKTNLKLSESVASNLNLDFEYKKFVKDRLGHDFRYSID